MTMSKPQFETFIIWDWNTFVRLVKYADAVGKNFVAFDVETNGGPEKKTKLWGLGLAFTSKK